MGMTRSVATVDLLTSCTVSYLAVAFGLDYSLPAATVCCNGTSLAGKFVFVDRPILGPLTGNPVAVWLVIYFTLPGKRDRGSRQSPYRQGQSVLAMYNKCQSL